MSNIHFANENEIHSWLIDGNNKMAKYCMIILDSWDNECVYDYPVYAMSEEDVNQAKLKKFGPCTSVVEVFDLSRNIDELMNERRNIQGIK